jgi:hypothetical protein
MAKTNGRRNRNVGKAWELQIINILRKRGLYPHCVSTRSESRSLDGCGIDVMNKQEGLNGIMLDSIQAKSESKTVPYPKLLDRIRGSQRPNPVVFHRQTAKSGSRFMVRDRFAICYMDDYIELMAARIAIRKLRIAMEKLPDEHKQNFIQELEKLGL